jgi:MipA family protein
MSRSPSLFHIIATTALAAFSLASDALAQDGRVSNWSVSTGLGVLVFPEYAGSDEYRVLPMPLSEVTYRNRFYLGPSKSALGGGLGVHAIRTPRFGLALEIGAQPDRRAVRADALAGMEDRDWVGSAAASLSYRFGLFEASMSVMQGFNDGAGTLGTTGVSFSQPIGRLIPTASIGMTFADAKQMRRDFGVTPMEASRRQGLIDAGDPRLAPDEGTAYRPGGGLRNVSGSLSLVYVLSKRWSLMSLGGVDGLSVEAQDSPIVRRRDQYWGIAGLNYHF